MKAMAMSLYGPKQKANGKTTKEGKNKVGHGAGDEEFLPLEGEENLSVYSDDDESFRSQAKKLRANGQHASVPTSPNSLGRSKRKRGLSRGITVLKML
ncbi:hypothetical protein RHSIM_RhsimUnG0159400 [Rhododendron simsii]|uniref:Uncharacterized protein n=1 Tax=Rhododendron simsii TaxID=118357 RepID=A0A834L2E9_RHOSS|nr:hypothetical protein RHSIM_RhsimUnG0159400 [Rhododendron simsii]